MHWQRALHRNETKVPTSGAKLPTSGSLKTTDLARRGRFSAFSSTLRARSGVSGSFNEYEILGSRRSVVSRARSVVSANCSKTPVNCSKTANLAPCSVKSHVLCESNWSNSELPLKDVSRIRFLNLESISRIGEAHFGWPLK